MINKELNFTETYSLLSELYNAYKYDYSMRLSKITDIDLDLIDFNILVGMSCQEACNQIEAWGIADVSFKRDYISFRTGAKHITYLMPKNERLELVLSHGIDKVAWVEVTRKGRPREEYGTRVLPISKDKSNKH